MTQEELQKLLDEFGQSKIAQTPQWRIDHKELVREIGINNKGRKVSQKLKSRLSKKLKGRVITEEHANKISKALKGKSKSKEHKQKLSKVTKGRKMPHTSKRNTEMNSKRFRCEHCNREIGGLANYKRFHSDNCKHKS